MSYSDVSSLLIHFWPTSFSSYFNWVLDSLLFEPTNSTFSSYFNSYLTSYFGIIASFIALSSFWFDFEFYFSVLLFEDGFIISAFRFFLNNFWWMIFSYLLNLTSSFSSNFIWFTFYFIVSSIFFEFCGSSLRFLVSYLFFKHKFSLSFFTIFGPFLKFS